MSTTRWAASPPTPRPKRAYQQLLAEHPDDAGLHLEYGMLQDWHGRRSTRAAVACYERAIELDPGQDAPHFQLTHSRAALNETEHVIDLYKKRLAAAPDQIREYRFLARAYLYAGARDRGRQGDRRRAQAGPR